MYIYIDIISLTLVEGRVEDGLRTRVFTSVCAQLEIFSHF